MVFSLNLTKLLLWSLAVSMLAGCQTVSDNTSLDLLDEEYPKAFFFRRAAHITDTTSYEAWNHNFSRLSGIVVKALGEELVDTNEKLVSVDYRYIDAYYNRFKKEHPSQSLLLHFNGNARSPTYETADFYAGHWIYYNGASILSDLNDRDDISEIKVSDPYLFKTGLGRFDDRMDDIGLCELDEEGKPDWSRSEQVRLLSINYEERTIRVKRGCYNTEPRAFSAGKSYAAAHVVSGPWCPDCQLLWLYNFSTVSPVDSDGQRCIDVLAHDVAKRFAHGGELASFDGIQFDVTFESISKHPLVAGDYRAGSKRQPDLNADGMPDDGVFHGVNTFGEGMVAFFSKLRDLMDSNKLILADGNSSAQQRAFGIVNGIESEGWPFAIDISFSRWSAGINRNFFWDEFTPSPKLNYINYKWKDRPEAGVMYSANRLLLAAACLTNTAVSIHFFPSPDARPPYPYPIWDELVMGQENRIGWLGKPAAPATYLAKETQNLVGDWSVDALVERINSVNNQKVVAIKDGDKIRIEAKEIGSDMEIRLDAVPCSGADLTLFMTFTAAPLANHTTHRKRAFYVVPDEKDNARHHYASFADNERPFESVFYYEDINGPTQNFKVVFEGDAPVWLHGIEAYAHPPAMVREFENGVVLANPSDQPYRFDLDQIFGGGTYKRLQASEGQDVQTNNGQEETGVVEVNGKDGLFLIKD